MSALICRVCRIHLAKNAIKVRPYSTKLNVIHSKGRDILVPQNISVQDYLWKNLDKSRNKIATICAETNRSYTYEQLHRKSSILAGFLRKSLKLKEKDTVAIIMPNLPEYPIIMIGAIGAGLKVTTCNPNYTVDEIKRQLMDSEARAVFTSSSLLPQVQAAIGELGSDIPMITVNDGLISSDIPTVDFEQSLSGEPFHPVELDKDDVILLPYSSGTTGRPKGVQLTVNNILSNLYQFESEEFALIRKCDNDFQDVIPAFLPFYHIYGMTMIMFNGISSGCKLVTMPKFGLDLFKRVLITHRPTVMFGVPTTVNVITNNSTIIPDDLTSIRVFVSGAAPLGIADVERFLDKSKGRTNLIQAYGMTETSPLTIMQTKYFDGGSKIGGSGLLIPSTSAKVIPMDGSSLTGLGPGQSGELLIKGPQVMKGYYKNSQATQEILLDDGWIKTGDIVHYDHDQEFYITDRIKELIKVKGFQVAPAELEEILRDHPCVDDAAVIGVPHPHLGEAPKAFLVAKKGVEVKPSSVAEFVASKVTKHKHLVGGVVLIDSIPKNPSGKILRRELKKYS